MGGFVHVFIYTCMIYKYIYTYTIYIYLVLTHIHAYHLNLRLMSKRLLVREVHDCFFHLLSSFAFLICFPHLLSSFPDAYLSIWPLTEIIFRTLRKTAIFVDFKCSKSYLININYVSFGNFGSTQWFYLSANWCLFVY